jgi:alkylated DNA repair dioxygenase AlkB
MDTLFPMQFFPPGFTYIPDFLTSSEAQSLYNTISKIELHTFSFQGFEAKRQVASFGHDYNFDQKSISAGQEIPVVFKPIIKKVADHLQINPEDFQELLLTEYPIGSVINWHRDAFPFDVIVGISLCADCIFRLRPHDKNKRGKGSVISIPVKQRSLYVMRGEARMAWQHSIAPVKAKRYSVTLRTLKNRT